MTVILCEFPCKHCRRTIVLPRHTLSREFEDQEIQPTRIPRVALLCNHCRTVENYSEADLKGSPEGNTGHGWVVAEELPCVEESCQFRLLLFAKWSESTSTADRHADLLISRWNPLTCEAGHKVQKPTEVYGLPLS